MQDRAVQSFCLAATEQLRPDRQASGSAVDSTLSDHGSHGERAPIWRRLPLPGCGLTGAAAPLFGSGLAHRRLFPDRPASGHPAARAQAFLRARISAVLFSRAIYGMSSA